MILRSSAAVAVALALALAGCGGDDDDSTESPPATDAAAPLSKAEFTEQANEICRVGGEQIDARAEALGPDPSQAEIEEFATEVVAPNVQDQIDQIEALGAPEGDEDEVQEIVDAVQESLDEVEEDPSVLRTGDPFAEANRLAADYGLTVCAES